ncbi:hypothetical protein BH10PSE12_BH10PSE12_08260 [soil metagenome]
MDFRSAALSFKIKICLIQKPGGWGMKRFHVVGCLAAISSLSACASNPPVQVSYYLPRGEMVVSVIRSVGCNKQGTPRVLNTVTTKAVYSPDTANPQTIAIKALDGDFTNTEVGFTFADDGRLTGMNTTQAGQGGEIIQAALVVGGAVVGLAGGSPSTARDTACKYLADNFKDGVASLTFSIVEDFKPFGGGAAGRTTEVTVIAEDSATYDEVRILMGSVCLNVTAPDPTPAPITYTPGTRKDVMLKMRQPARVPVAVLQAEDLACAGTKGGIWKGIALVPQLGTSYDLPIPSAPVFGKQTFKLGLAESGAITALTYGKESGAASALTTAAKAIDAVDGSTVTERAAELKARADVIAQQERLIRCNNDPKACV